MLLSALLWTVFLSWFSLSAFSQDDPWYYVIQARAETGGIINPSGDVYVLQNSHITFEIFPDSAHQIRDLEVDGERIGPVSSYTFENVTSNHEIYVRFEDREYVIHATAGAGGTIDPEGEVIVVHGDDEEFRFRAHRDNEILDVRVDNISRGPLDRYRFRDVSSDHTIHAVFTSSMEILNLSIPDEPMGIGDVVMATLTVNPPSEIPYTLISGNVGGYPLEDFHSLSENTYMANFTIEEGGNNYTASQNIPVTDLVISNGVQSSLPYNLPIIQGNDPIDSQAPLVTRLEVLSMEVGVGGIVRMQVSADGTGYTAGTGSFINGVPVSSNRVSFTELGNGLYELSYLVASEDAAVAAGMLEASLVLVDAAGNAGIPYASIEPNYLEIYTDLPTATLDGPLQICEGETVELSVLLTGRSPWSFDLYDGTSTTSFTGISTANYLIELSPVQTSTYQITTLTDVNGVVNTNFPAHRIIVNERAEVEILNLEQGYYREDDPVLLEANIPGGVFSGPGVNNITGYFDPGLADTLNSPHTIFYTYENDLGCTSSTSSRVYVWGSERGIFIPGNRVCLNSAPFTATVLNIPEITGTFRLLDSDDQAVAGLTDHGDNTASIDPALLSIDTFTIEFQYENLSMQYLREAFTVESSVQPQILNLDDMTYCQNIIPFVLESNLENVLFEGPGVYGTVNDGFTFDPREISPGSIEISCTYVSDLGCTGTTRRSVEILDAPDVNFALSTACTREGGEIASFHNQTTNISDIESWNWNFGDPASGSNNQSNLENPTHHYQIPGRFNINLSATTREGCFASYELDTLINSRPIADFTWISDCFVQEAAVTFIDRSINQTASIDTLLWTFKTRSEDILGEIRADPGNDTVSFLFDSPDSFLVDLYAVSPGGCSSRITKEIILRPTIQLDHEGYLEDFNTSDGMWSVHSDNQWMSWVWGSPDFNGYTPVEGDNAWYTDLPAGINAYQENSWIQSPCMDLSGMDRPMIKLDLMKSFVPYIDGAVIQYRDVIEEGWKTLGKSATGIEWYNMEDIMQQPGGSSNGWGLTEFSPDTAWIPAMHDLDQVSGEANVTLRIAIATSGVFSLGNQGFAFDNIAITPRTKLTVLEHFTNCNDDTSALADHIIDTLVSEHPGDVIDLHYHMDYRDPDPMNNNNPDPPSTRSFYYGIPKVPFTVFEGGSFLYQRYDYQDLNTKLIEDQLRLHTLDNHSFDVELSVEWLADGLEASATITCLKDGFDDYLQLYLVVFETEVTAYSGNNGDKHFRNVVLDMLPTAAGKLIDKNWEEGISEVRSYSWAYKPYVEDIEDLAVAAFIQERSSNKILQAAVEYQDLSVGRSDPFVHRDNLHIYPNPAHRFIHVNLGYQMEHSGRIELYDIQGKLVLEETIPPGYQVIQLNTSQLNNGLYLLRLRESAKIKGVSKLVVKH